MQMIKYYTRGFISKSLLLHDIWKNKKLALQICLQYDCNFTWNELKRAASWSSGSAFVSGARGQISGMSNQTVLPTARYCCNISSKGAELLGRNAAEMGSRKLITCFSVIQRVQRKTWFWFDKVKWQLKSQAQKNIRVLGENSTTKHTQNSLIHEYWPSWVSNSNVW